MSETPTPSKRRGLALPPRGQTLARLQDLEQEAEPGAAQPDEPGEPIPSTQGSNAVNTARSNAVNHQGSTAVRIDPDPEQVPAQPAQVAPPVPPQEQPAAVAAGSGHRLASRAVREPTTRITVDMPDSLHRKISLLSVETRRSIKDLVIEALAATYFGTGGSGE